MFRNNFNQNNKKDVQCPYCKSDNTDFYQSVGPAACRNIYICNDCDEHFESLKPRSSSDDHN